MGKIKGGSMALFVVVFVLTGCDIAPSGGTCSTGDTGQRLQAIECSKLVTDTSSFVLALDSEELSMETISGGITLIPLSEESKITWKVRGDKIVELSSLNILFRAEEFGTDIFGLAILVKPLRSGTTIIEATHSEITTPIRIPLTIRL